MKGKVIESMKCGVPVITTDVGAEGLPSDPASYLNIANTEDDFTKEVINLLSDEFLVIEKKTKIDSVLRTEFSRNAAVNAVNKMFRPH